MTLSLLRRTCGAVSLAFCFLARAESCPDRWSQHLAHLGAQRVAQAGARLEHAVPAFPGTGFTPVAAAAGDYLKTLEGTGTYSRTEIVSFLLGKIGEIRTRAVESARYRSPRAAGSDAALEAMAREEAEAQYYLEIYQRFSGSENMRVLAQ